MADRLWIGGASTTTQVDTFTLNDDSNDSETSVTMTMTAENGSTTQTVSITPSGTDESVIAAAWQAALATSTQTLFTQVTWTVASNVVTGTAVDSGVPFYAASSVTGGAMTITDSTDTANAGPNDYNTAANWVDEGYSSAAVPVATNDVQVVENPTDGLSYDITYGLDQSAVEIATFRVSETFEGGIGDDLNGYYLHIDTTGVCSFNGQGNYCWVKGTNFGGNVYVNKGLRRDNMLRLAGTMGGAKKIIIGPVAGTVTLADSMALANSSIFMVDTVSTSSLKVGQSVSNIGAVALAGTAVFESAFAAATIYTGGQCKYKTASTTLTSITMAGGTYVQEAAADVTALVSYAGVARFGTVTGASTISTTTVYGGTVDALGGMGNVVFTSITKYGGEIRADVGSTPDPQG